MTTFTETEERLALRKAVAELGRKYGRDYFLRGAAEGGKTTELWQEAGKLGYLGVAVPEEYGGGGGDIGDLAAVCEELAAAGSPLLLMVVSPGDRRHDHRPVRHRRAEEALAARHRRRRRTIAFSITESDAGIELAPDHHDGPRGRRRLAAQGRQDVHLRRRRGRERARRRPHRGREDRQPQAGAVHRPDRRRGLRRQRSTWTSSRRRSSSPCSSTTCGCPPTRWSATRTPASSSCSPASTPSASWAPRFAGPARLALEKATEYAKERQVWKAPIGSHQAIAHPLAQTYIEIEMARLMTQKAAALYAPATTWRRRGGQHGEVRGRRGRVQRRRPGHPDPRRQRRWPRSTASWGCWSPPASRIAPVSRGDGAQLHRPVLPGPAEVLLKPMAAAWGLGRRDGAVPLRHPRALRRSPGSTRLWSKTRCPTERGLKGAAAQSAPRESDSVAADVDDAWHHRASAHRSRALGSAPTWWNQYTPWKTPWCSRIQWSRSETYGRTRRRHSGGSPARACRRRRGRARTPPSPRPRPLAGHGSPPAGCGRDG